jgi:hypothetical protein
MTTRPLAIALALAASLVAPAALAQQAEEVQVGAPAPPPPPPPPVVIVSTLPPAGVVQTNHVDTVIVVQPGSNVNVTQPSAEPHAPYVVDTARRDALIVTPIAWGIGTFVTGIGYLGKEASGSPAGGWLAAYDVNMAFVPSIPRWVVGDWTGAAVFTGLRAASVISASLLPWKDALGPTTLGFLVPVALGAIDLATTPRRELTPPPPTTAKKTGPSLTGVAPVALSDPNHHVNGGLVSLQATF